MNGTYFFIFISSHLFLSKKSQVIFWLCYCRRELILFFFEGGRELMNISILETKIIHIRSLLTLKYCRVLFEGFLVKIIDKLLVFNQLIVESLFYSKFWTWLFVYFDFRCNHVHTFESPWLNFFFLSKIKNKNTINFKALCHL